MQQTLIYVVLSIFIAAAVCNDFEFGGITVLLFCTLTIALLWIMPLIVDKLACLSGQGKTDIGVRKKKDGLDQTVRDVRGASGQLPRYKKESVTHNEHLPELGAARAKADEMSTAKAKAKASESLDSDTDSDEKEFARRDKEAIAALRRKVKKNGFVYDPDRPFIGKQMFRDLR